LHGFVSDPPEVAKDEPLLAILHDEDDHRFGYLFPPSGDHFGGLEIGLIWQQANQSRLPWGRSAELLPWLSKRLGG
jgi:hypothetical protein